MTIALMWAMNANALIVSITGQGDIPAQGMELTLTEAEEDPLSGEKRMEINGTLLSSGALNVTIVRTAAGLNDEFCAEAFSAEEMEAILDTQVDNSAAQNDANVLTGGENNTTDRFGRMILC